jgi:hypothetical protein
MPFETFRRQRITGGPPRVTITKYNNLVLNSATMERHLRAVKYVHLLWDSERLRVGIKPVTKQDQSAYPLHNSARGNVATISGVSFLRYIGWNLKSETKSFEAEWNDKESLLEFRIDEGDREPKRFPRHRRQE